MANRPTSASAKPARDKTYRHTIVATAFHGDGVMSGTTHEVETMDYLTLVAVQDAAKGSLDTLEQMGYGRAATKGFPTAEVDQVRSGVREAKKKQTE